MPEITLILNELDCANCANKIERAVQKKLDNDTVSVSFATKMLKFTPREGEDAQELISKVVRIVKKTEKSVHITVKTSDRYKFDAHTKNDRFEFWFTIARIAVATVMLLFLEIVGEYLITLNEWVELGIAITGYLIAGYSVIIKAVTNLFRGRIFDENMLMLIATAGAFAIGEFHEAVAVMLLYQIGEFFQHLAVGRSRKNISKLMDIRPDHANLLVKGKVKQVSPEEVKVGSVIQVKPGERIPLDGRVISGSGQIDARALTGESAPISVSVGCDVLSGAININGLLEVEVLKPYSQSTVAKILGLVENASSKKANTENFISKFALWYTPIVVGLALLLTLVPPMFLGWGTFSEWLERGLVFLVISCPCALVISIPLSYFGGIGSASKRGVLIKGSNHLETLNTLETVVFDKTGTLTKGEFMVVEVKAVNGFSNDVLTLAAAAAESKSTHPIAKCIASYNESGINAKITDYIEIGGEGIRAKVDTKLVYAGSAELLNKNGIKTPKVETYGTTVFVSIDNKCAGYIVVADAMKSDSIQAIIGLREQGVKRIYLLTGDNARTGAAVANQLNIEDYYTSLLPHQKVEKLEEIMQAESSRGSVAFVGDGLNDAPALARADVGIAMGGVGSDAAIEAADIVLMNDSPSKIVDAIKIAHRTRRIVWQNIIFAIGVKVVVMVLGAMGIAGMWAAVFADVGVTMIAVLNSMRAMLK